MGFCLFCETEVVGKVDNACGVSFVESDAAFVDESGHSQKLSIKGSPVVADAATVLIGHGVPAGIL